MSYNEEYKEVTEKRRVTVSIRCDNCGAIHEGSRIPPSWHKFSSHHNEWGNNSVDSFEYHHVCKPQCYVELIKKLTAEYSDYPSLEVDDMSLEFAQSFLQYIDEV